MERRHIDVTTSYYRDTRHAQPTMEGAGVHLHRAFGFQDPSEAWTRFYCLMILETNTPRIFCAGSHGIPIVALKQSPMCCQELLKHGDSLGNEGTLGAGDVQWMTAGSGILHQEMPKGNANGQMHGFQLWANLPSSLKMTAPRYQDVQGKDIPEIIDDDGTRVKVIVGNFWGKSGPVDGIAADPQYLDIYVPAGVKKTFKVDTYRKAFAYVFEGAGAFADASAPEGVLLEKEVMGEEVNIRDMSGNRTLIKFGTGEEVTVQAGEEGIRFLLISGAPIQEPVAWHGPIVMNTREELMQAFAELRNGTFIKPAH